MCNIIEEKFNKNFPELTDVFTEKEIFSGNKKTITKLGWDIKLSVEENSSRLYVEYYGVYNQKYHTHVRIYNDGQEEYLNTLRQYIAYSPKIPGDREKSTRDFTIYNQNLISELKYKGLI